MTNTTTQPRVYVGTYAKYNSGSIKGDWISLDGHDEESFMEACKSLHLDELDPELMFQDYEGFPKSFYGESHLSETLWDWIECDEEEREIWEAYADAVGYPIGETTLEDAQDAYAGTYDSEADFAEELTNDIGDVSSIPSWLVACIDWRAVWDSTLRFDYCSIKASDGVMFFRLN